MKTLPTITLHRPWALWVREGWKTIETRLHERFRGLIGQEIYIHAGQKWDKGALKTANKWLTDAQFIQTSLWMDQDEARGMIVARCYVENAFWIGRSLESSPAGWLEAYQKKALIECRTTRFGLILSNIEKLNFGPLSGGQGIFMAPKQPPPLTQEEINRYIEDIKDSD